MKISDVIIQKNEECDTYLTKALFPVNMRLYTSSKPYKEIIRTAFSHMRKLMKLEKFEDYPELSGISGANVGVPWNIIIVRLREEKLKGELFHMINPVIIEKSTEVKTTQSNCGSLNLPNRVIIKRHLWVKVYYFNLKGKKRVKNFVMKKGTAGTIQHEVEHNQGILITDKGTKQ